MTKRLSPDRLEEIRAISPQYVWGRIYAEELLAHIDALEGEIDDLRLANQQLISGKRGDPIPTELFKNLRKYD